MKIYEVATNDHKLNEWDPNIIGWGLDALKGLTKGIRKKSRISDLKKDAESRKDNSTRPAQRGGGSDEYDHIIKKYR